MHDATTPWVESVNSSQFTACVTRAGRNDYPSDSFATIDWIAYQGAPSGGVAGEEMFTGWWTGTSCQTVTLPKVRQLLPSSTYVYHSIVLNNYFQILAAKCTYYIQKIRIVNSNGKFNIRYNVPKLRNEIHERFKFLTSNSLKRESTSYFFHFLHSSYNWYI